MKKRDRKSSHVLPSLLIRPENFSYLTQETPQSLLRLTGNPLTIQNRAYIHRIFSHSSSRLKIIDCSTRVANLTELAENTGNLLTFRSIRRHPSDCNRKSSHIYL